MDSSNFLVVRFHYNGVFTHDGPKVRYAFGREEISHVGLRTLSLSMLLVNLKVHYNMARGGGIMMLHWLSPRKELSNGLPALVDDSVVHRMAKSVKDGGLEPAHIYVEDIITNEHEVCKNEDEVPAASEEKAKEIDGFVGSGESESDSDFVPSDCSTSDDEVEEIKKNYKEFKRNRKRKSRGEKLH